MDLGTLRLWLLGWGCLISHFWIGACLNKLSCLVPDISSLIFLISCRVWSDIHISLTFWLSRWISWFPQCAHLGRTCTGGMMQKKSEGAKFHCHHDNMWLWNLYPYIWYSLALILIWFWIFLYCCMLGLTWNLSSLILCVRKGSHLQIKIHGLLHILVVFGHRRGQGGPWDGLVLLWTPYDCLALYDGYLGAIDGFCSADVIGGNQTVSDLVLLYGFF